MLAHEIIPDENAVEG